MEQPIRFYDFEGTLLSYQEQPEFTFGKEEKKWFNGQWMSPMDIYQAQFCHGNGSLKIRYEVRKTEPDSPSAQIGSMGDRHFCTIICDISSETFNSPFEITERSILKKIFKRRPSHYFIVKTPDPQLREKLISNTELNELFKLVESSPEFSPAIKGERDSSTALYRVTIFYGGTKKMRDTCLRLCIEFCKTLMN